jgi:sRNA-binding regulator protein Hfq
MNDTMDSAPAGEPVEKESFSNRKLIRPTLPRTDHNHGNHNSTQLQAPERRERPERHDRPSHDRTMRDRPLQDRPLQDRPGQERASHERPERAGGERQGFGGKKLAPPEQTNAENFYYQKQMQSQTPLVIVLRDGEQIHGVIEWYDKNCLKVVRDGGKANLMIYKPAIKYIYKEGEGH